MTSFLLLCTSRLTPFPGYFPHLLLDFILILVILPKPIRFTLFHIFLLLPYYSPQFIIHLICKFSLYSVSGPRSITWKQHSTFNMGACFAGTVLKFLSLLGRKARSVMIYFQIISSLKKFPMLGWCNMYFSNLQWKSFGFQRCIVSEWLMLCKEFIIYSLHLEYSLRKFP